MIALPVGLLSAIFLSEYAPRRLRGVLKPMLELLAGIPTIVYGYIALLLVTPVLKAILEPIGRDPLTVADDSKFLERIAAQPNVPLAVRDGLKSLY